VNRQLPLLPLLLLITVICCCPYHAHAQIEHSLAPSFRADSYYFRHYQAENGLSNNTVFCSIQDTKGFLWFGTKEGLNRFDGYRFKLFKLDEDERKLKRDVIYCLSNDQQGTLWVGTQNGLYRYDALHERLVRFIDSLPEINGIQMDKNGRLWFISRQTVCYYNFSTHTIRLYPTDRYFKASALCLSEEGDMWFATEDGYLQQYNAATETFKKHSLAPLSGRMNSCGIRKLHPAGKQSLFIGTSCQGLKLFNVLTGNCGNILTYNTDKTTVYIRDIMQYSANEFWFATESGIFILNRRTGQFINLKKKFNDPYSLSDNAVYTLCKDREGGVWAGSFFGGVNYYPRPFTPFQKYYPDSTGQTISGNAVREICEDKYGNIWIGTEDAGVNKLNPKTGAITHFKPTGAPGSISYYNIHGLLASGNDLWIGTHDHGLDVMDIRTGKVKKHYPAGTGSHQFTNNFIVAFLETRKGDIYIGTGSSLYRYRKQTDDFEHVQAIPRNDLISCITEDHSGTIWAGSRSGVFYYNPVTQLHGKFKNNPADTNSLSMNDINAICEDSRHIIWVSTEGGGLCALDTARKGFTRYTTANGLPSNYVFKVIEDNGALWVSTSKGLARLDPVKQNLVVYTKANGLLYDQFNYNSGYRDATGKLYFGCIKGMITFNPANFAENKFDPPVYITGFQVQNKELAINKDNSPLQKSIMYTSEIVLPYDQSSFSIDFAALSYTTPEITAYKYKMEALEKEWTQVRMNRKVYFTNLAPGNYTFRVMAATNGHWGQEKQLTIIITPPFWATRWAWCIYAFIVLAIGYYVVRSYHKRAQIKKEKEIYEAKFNFFTNVAHEIRTPLTLIKGPVDNLLEKIDELPAIKEDVTMMERNTNRLMTLITQILDFRQTEAKGFSLDFSKVNITQLLQEAWVSFQPLAKKRNLQYILDLPAAPVMAMADEDALLKIFSNLLSNAVKYGDRQVTVTLYPVQKEDTYITIEFSNDGFIIPAPMKERIFEPFYRIKETMKQKGTGIGLSLARSLVQLHAGSLYLKEGSSTVNTFVLCLPVSSQPLTGEPIRKTKTLI
jgi:signal transduction histidine kinase/ligand-binding sensor domain-containing protein